MTEQLYEAVAKFREQFWGVEPDIDLPTTQFDIGSGLSGLSLTLLTHYDITDDARLLFAAERYIDFVAKHLNSLAFDQFFEASHMSSLYFSYPGAFAVQALTKLRLHKLDEASRAISCFTASVSEPGPDVIWGAAGLLLAAIALLHEKALPSADRRRLERFSAEMARRCSEYVYSQIPNMPTSDVLNRSFAHGWPGVVYALLRFQRYGDSSLASFLQTVLDRAAENSISFSHNAGGEWETAPPSARWFHTSWCNGASGMVYLWTEAYRTLGNEAFQKRAFDAALFAGNAVAPQSIYSLSMCCGLASQAYAVARMYRIGEGKAWKGRSIQIALLVEKLARQHPLPQYSLLRGAAGHSILYAHLLVGSSPRLPLIE